MLFEINVLELRGGTMMSKEKSLNRRKLIRNSLTAIGAMTLVGKGLHAQSLCSLNTPNQPAGPFYPEQDQLDKNTDLTQVQGNTELALGEVIVMKGEVTNQLCVPLKGALVEIWQACATGKYNHSGDPNSAVLDPNFQYWGQAITNDFGEYSFKTIKPGAYPANRTWMRPPHIHLKAHLRAHQELTTQVYFSEDKTLNQSDRILQQLSAEERKSVIIEFKNNQVNQPTSLREGTFDITLVSI